MTKYGIYQNDGQLIVDSVRDTRKAARRDFAMDNGTKWPHLWLLGYKVSVVKIQTQPLIPDDTC